MRHACVVSLLAAVACGHPGPVAPAPSGTGTVTDTYSGSTRTTASGSCTGDTHAFAAADGSIVLRLVRASRPLTAQICASGVGSPDCSLTRRPVAVSETIEVAKRGAGNQVLSFLPLDCVSGQTFSPEPATYTATVTFHR